MFSGKNTNEALGEKEAFLSVSFEFRSWFIACSSWRHFLYMPPLHWGYQLPQQQ